ncbi:MAG: STAS domain-containing protein [Lachnospiraceae bacterium]
MNVKEDFKVIDDYLCIKMPDEIDHHNAEKISGGADYYILHNNINNIVFDFEDTSLMDSSGIGVIVGRYKKILAFGGKVYVVHANNRIKKIIEMSGLNRIVKIVEE